MWSVSARRLPARMSVLLSFSCATRWQQMVPRGLEPRTLRLLAVRSKQLSYETCRLKFAACADAHACKLERPTIEHTYIHTYTHTYTRTRVRAYVHACMHTDNYHKMTPVGFKPTPFRNGALSHRLRPLGQSVDVPSMQAKMTMTLQARPYQRFVHTG